MLFNNLIKRTCSNRQCLKNKLAFRSLTTSIENVNKSKESESETHFGYQTVKESEKEGKGKYSVNYGTKVVLDTFPFFTKKLPKIHLLRPVKNLPPSERQTNRDRP